MLKFRTDGAMLTNKKNAVQGTIRIFQVEKDWIPIVKGSLPNYFNQELPVYYFISKFNKQKTDKNWIKVLR